MVGLRNADYEIGDEDKSSVDKREFGGFSIRLSLGLVRNTPTAILRDWVWIGSNIYSFFSNEMMT